MNPINFKYVLKLLAYLVYILASSMSLPLIWLFIDPGKQQVEVADLKSLTLAFSGSIMISAFIGSLLRFLGRHAEPFLGKRESLLLVSLTWFIGAAISALPFWLWAHYNQLNTIEFYSYINCYFEGMSGLTTTGSTVLSDIEIIPSSLLLWRSLTHWLGGLGIVVIFVAILPEISGSKKQLFHTESSGIDADGSSVSVGEKARKLILIYLSLSLLQMLLMFIIDSDIKAIDVIVHTFSTISSGGFSNYNASAGALTYPIQMIIACFMLLAGVNFSIYHKILMGQVKESWHNPELRLYLFITLVAFLFILQNIFGSHYDTTKGVATSSSALVHAMHAFFQTASLQTGTGFATVNFDQWSTFSKSLIVMLMLIGGCGGSTCGGIKVIRILGMFKLVFLEIQKSFRPSIVKTIKIGGKSTNDRQNIAILSFIILFLVLIGLSSLLIIFLEQNISGVSALTATLASISNVGPGLDEVGAIANYSWFSPLSKMILSILMVVGRLEIFAVVVLFLPKFWIGK